MVRKPDLKKATKTSVAEPPLWWKNKFVLAAAGVAVALVIYNWLGSTNTNAGLSLQSEAVVAIPQPVVDTRAPRNTSEAVGRDLEALRQLSQAYGLTPEQEQAIREIIESANYSP